MSVLVHGWFAIGERLRGLTAARALTALLALGLLAGCGDRYGFEATESGTVVGPRAATADPAVDVEDEIRIFAAKLAAKRPHRLNAEQIGFGLSALAEGRYVEANESFQRALKYEPRNPYLHMLNGLCHQLRGDAGDPEQYELAAVGYGLAARIDPGDSEVPYLMGVLQFRQQRYRRAQDNFATAVSLDGDRPDYLLALAASSYYLGELDRAYTAIRRAQELAPHSAATLHTGGVIYASLGAFDKAKANNLQLASLAPRRQRFLERRIADWQDYYENGRLRSEPAISRQLTRNPDVFGVPADGVIDADGLLLLASLERRRHVVPGRGGADRQDTSGSGRERSEPAISRQLAQNLDVFGVPEDGRFDVDGTGGLDSGSTDGFADDDGADPFDQQPDAFAGDDGADPSARQAPAAPSAAAATQARAQIPRMALIDVAIIRTEEISRTSKGVNLLNGLDIFFSGQFTLEHEAQFGSDSDGGSGGGDDIVTLQLGPAGAGLTYSLNIFSDDYDRNEVIARPTILVEDQKKSSFFSGGTMHIVLEGGVAGSGAIEPISTGIRLEVRPQFIDAETLDVSVFAERTFLEAGLSQVSDTITGTTFATTSRTSISANLTLRYGETMVLSGLSDQERDLIDDKVPGLGDLPGIQYLFRNQTATTSKKTVLILLTPRQASLSYEDGTPIENPRAPAADTRAEELEESLPWMRPAPHLKAFVETLSRHDFFNLYRKGDMQLEEWASPAALADAIIRTLDYLYINYDLDAG